MDIETTGTEEQSSVPFPFQLVPANYDPAKLLDNVRSSLARGLPEVRECAPHDAILSVAGGGPSLADTYTQLEGCIAAINGSLQFLLDKGVVPHLCGVCDPSPHMVDIVTAHEQTAYFIASHCTPALFDKLLAAGCTVYLWHNHPVDGLDDLLTEHYGERGWVQVPGGSTMGLRWVTLGYLNGFRRFHLHGMDSSFRATSTHAYPDHQDHKQWVTFEGFKTRINFVGQVRDFELMLDELSGPGVDPVELKVYGEGLLQSRYRRFEEKHPPLAWPPGDVNGQRYILAESRNILSFLRLLPRRGVCVQAGGNVGVYPRRLARDFDVVHTFEPDPYNFKYLRENLRQQKNVISTNAALSDRFGYVTTASHEDGNCGAVHIERADDGVPSVTIDSLDLSACDLIWLDIEGHEHYALLGARKTIEQFRPALILEENRATTIEDRNAIAALLRGLQYYRVAKHGNDVLYVYGGDDLD